MPGPGAHLKGPEGICRENCSLPESRKRRRRVHLRLFKRTSVMCVCVHRRRFHFSSFLMKNVVAVVWPLIGAGESCGASEMLDIFWGKKKKKNEGWMFPRETTFAGFLRDGEQVRKKGKTCLRGVEIGELRCPRGVGGTLRKGENWQRFSRKAAAVAIASPLQQLLLAPTREITG